jgi:5-methylcytosine-specific restriction enzyme A
MSKPALAWRRDVLRRDPWCRDPGGRHPSELRASTAADHVLPLTAGGSWELENGQGLCASCHAAKTTAEDGGFGNAPKRRGA